MKVYVVMFLVHEIQEVVGVAQTKAGAERIVAREAERRGEAPVYFPITEHEVEIG